MSLVPVAYIAPNYRDFPTSWLKFYEPGTTTPKSMATDVTGATTVAKAQLDIDGFIVTAGNTKFIPFVDGGYDAWLFPTEAEADANDTTNAERVADNIDGPLDASDIITISGSEFSTIATMTASTDLISGHVARTRERTSGNGGGGTYDVVLTTSVTPNTYNIVIGVADPTVSFLLRNKPELLDMRAWGAYDAADASLMANSAWDQFPGKRQHYSGDGDGTVDYVFQTTVDLDCPIVVGEVFTQGPTITGDGMGVTYFDNQVSSAPMFSLDTGGTPGSSFLMGAVLKGFKVATTTGTSQIAINLLTSYMVEINQVHIDGMDGTGIRIPTVLGDNDGSNMIKLRQVRIENCTGWGINASGDPGFNEFSFMDMEHVFIQNCGTDSAAYQPPSGGMAWKGQIFNVSNCAFTLNKNCAMWIPGESGLAQTVDLQNTTFENNEKRNIFCRGISAFKARNIQQYHNDSFVGLTGIEFEGASFTIRNIDIDGCVVRATSGNNAFTAFMLSGVNTDLDTCRVRNVVWDNYDYAGQTRFSGWQFDAVQNDCNLETTATVLVTLKPSGAFGIGNKIPLRLSGGNGGVPSTSGEWVEAFIPSGGLFANNGGLLANTRYYCYLYDNNGVKALELSTTAFIADSQSGYAVKSGDATRYYVGSVETNGAAEFLTSGGGWLCPSISYDGPQGGVAVYRWADTTTTHRQKYAVAPTSNSDGTLL